MREYNKQQQSGESDLAEDDPRAPLGDFYGDPDQVQSWLS
jgi:hypothetical protein